MKTLLLVLDEDHDVGDDGHNDIVSIELMVMKVLCRYWWWWGYCVDSFDGDDDIVSIVMMMMTTP